jgi:hypothetical protein
MQMKITVVLHGYARKTAWTAIDVSKEIAVGGAGSGLHRLLAIP